MRSLPEIVADNAMPDTPRYRNPADISVVDMRAHLKKVHGFGGTYVAGGRSALCQWHSNDHCLNRSRMIPHEHEVTS